MNRRDLIDMEQSAARAYRREARARREKYPALADLLETYADASTARAERFRVGPLFGKGADA